MALDMASSSTAFDPNQTLIIFFKKNQILFNRAFMLKFH